jgi:hypothetical protein
VNANDGGSMSALTGQALTRRERQISEPVRAELLHALRSIARLRAPPAGA